ncbi:hypothetical protein [Alicyclobacillus herbarius]|uniref:hypothetical protein n=1 Tax=Alicyclobacillus herbarius TaxID=122960 RepID=UPI00047D8717|nr:hypothetical protein [Alicyclobacillus herbarius]
MNMPGLAELEAVREARRVQADFETDVEPMQIPFPSDTVDPFPVDVFPDPLARFVIEGAASLNCPRDFLGVPITPLVWIYRIVVDGDPVATATTMRGALQSLEDLVRRTKRRPGHTVVVELQDNEGKQLRVCYLPPWPKEMV